MVSFETQCGVDAVAQHNELIGHYPGKRWWAIDHVRRLHYLIGVELVGREVKVQARQAIPVMETLMLAGVKEDLRLQEKAPEQVTHHQGGSPALPPRWVGGGPVLHVDWIACLKRP